ncbi:hypothetical protein F2Q70_00001426 [Brassica cretica]|uniref:Uncharacterized protein n=1 Tax=Brassica cretica TaxID=69181 RepID=A0A8S9J382_BRACR|nr:hypothetical protein F2Q70_00001426 [Brassica cretica]
MIPSPKFCLCTHDMRRRGMKLIVSLIMYCDELCVGFKLEIVCTARTMDFVSNPNSTDAKPWSSDSLFLLWRAVTPELHLSL